MHDSRHRVLMSGAVEQLVAFSLSLCVLINSASRYVLSLAETDERGEIADMKKAEIPPLQYEELKVQYAGPFLRNLLEKWETIAVGRFDTFKRALKDNDTNIVRVEARTLFGEATMLLAPGLRQASHALLSAADAEASGDVLRPLIEAVQAETLRVLSYWRECFDSPVTLGAAQAS